MGRKGERRTIERGIYEDASGYEVVARAGKLSRSRRYPLTEDLKTLRTWRDETAAELRDEAQPTTDSRTLAAGVEKYYQVTNGAREDYRPALNAWKAEYGHLKRRKVTAALAVQAIERWRLAGYGPQTLYYRRLVLEQLWKTLDGPTVKTPVDHIHITRPKGKRPVWVSDELIFDVLVELKRHEMLKRLRTAKTRARFLVLATTGQRPAQMKRAQRGDVELERGIWWVRAAKGGDPTPVYLTTEMKDAWTAFIKANAWGEYDTRSFAKTLKRCGWPKGIRPYNVRHAVGMTLSESGADLADIQSHMGHTDISTTRTFYVPQLHSRLKQLSASLEGRFRGRSVAPKRGTNGNR